MLCLDNIALFQISHLLIKQVSSQWTLSHRESSAVAFLLWVLCPLVKASFSLSIHSWSSLLVHWVSFSSSKTNSFFLLLNKRSLMSYVRQALSRMQPQTLIKCVYTREMFACVNGSLAMELKWIGNRRDCLAGFFLTWLWKYTLCLL